MVELVSSDTDDARDIILAFLNGTLERKAGYDRKVEAAIALLYGHGNSEAGRKRLAALALAEHFVSQLKN